MQISPTLGTQAPSSSLWRQDSVGRVVRIQRPIEVVLKTIPALCQLCGLEQVMEHRALVSTSVKWDFETHPHGIAQKRGNTKKKPPHFLSILSFLFHQNTMLDVLWQIDQTTGSISVKKSGQEPPNKDRLPTNLCKGFIFGSDFWQTSGLTSNPQPWKLLHERVIAITKWNVFLSRDIYILNWNSLLR